MRNVSRDDDAVLWSWVAESRTVGRLGLAIEPGWYRIDGGTAEQMSASLAVRLAYAARNGVSCDLVITRRGPDRTGDDGRKIPGSCPKPSREGSCSAAS